MVLQRHKGSCKKKKSSGLYKLFHVFFFFFWKATKHGIPQPPLVSLRLQKEGNREGEGHREKEKKTEAKSCQLLGYQ